MMPKNRKGRLNRALTVCVFLLRKLPVTEFDAHIVFSMCTFVFCQFP